jgi:hypothetical protein
MTFILYSIKWSMNFVIAFKFNIDLKLEKKLESLYINK